MKVSAMLRQAEELDPHKKVKDLLTHYEKARDELQKMFDNLELHVGDFYKKYPKTAQARDLVDTWHKKLKDLQTSTFTVLGKLRKLDKEKE